MLASKSFETEDNVPAGKFIRKKYEKNYFSILKITEERSRRYPELDPDPFSQRYGDPKCHGLPTLI
jgi:hypothetical protein